MRFPSLFPFFVGSSSILVCQGKRFVRGPDCLARWRNIRPPPTPKTLRCVPGRTLFFAIALVCVISSVWDIRAFPGLYWKSACIFSFLFFRSCRAACFSLSAFFAIGEVVAVGPDSLKSYRALACGLFSRRFIPRSALR